MTRVLELFAGIGGVAEALRGTDATVVGAIDHDEASHRTYVANHAHPAVRLNLATVRFDRLAAYEADAWWMSPPCQPFTVRGRRRDIDDPRCAALLRLIEAIGVLRPRFVGLENVPGFAGSVAHTRLVAMLRAHDYAIVQGDQCPSDWGIANERRRFYLRAEHEGLDAPLVDPRSVTRPLATVLDEMPDEALFVPEGIADRYAQGLAVVDAHDPDAVAHCFTSAYGRSWVYSGSYLRDRGRIRRFSPGEILRLLGFRPGFALWPPALDKRFKLVGNTVSVDVVRAILAPWGTR